MTAFLDEPRDVQAVLAQLDHTFNIGINGLGSLGRAILCSSFSWPYIRIVAVNDASLNVEQVARLLREDQYQDFLDHVAYQPPDSLILRKADMNRTITFRSERDPAQISWKALQVLHVVECAGDFTTVESASQHLHVPICFDRESDFASIHGIEFGEQGGAMKVLIASTSESCNAPKIYPGINDMECKFHEYVVACAPPYTADRNAPAEWEDLWQYSRQVLRLLSLILARDGSVASQFLSDEEVHGSRWDGNKSPLVTSLEQTLELNLPGARTPTPMEDWFMEAANSPYIEIVGDCGCCQRNGRYAR